MCSCHSVLECCIMFSGVKLSMGSFVLLLLFGVILFPFPTVQRNSIYASFPYTQFENSNDVTPVQ